MLRAAINGKFVIIRVIDHTNLYFKLLKQWITR